MNERQYNSENVGIDGLGDFEATTLGYRAAVNHLEAGYEIFQDIKSDMDRFTNPRELKTYIERSDILDRAAEMDRNIDLALNGDVHDKEWYDSIEPNELARYIETTSELGAETFDDFVESQIELADKSSNFESDEELNLAKAYVIWALDQINF